MFALHVTSGQAAGWGQHVEGAVQVPDAILAASWSAANGTSIITTVIIFIFMFISRSNSSSSSSSSSSGIYDYYYESSLVVLLFSSIVSGSSISISIIIGIIVINIIMRVTASCQNLNLEIWAQTLGDLNFPKASWIN